MAPGWQHILAMAKPLGEASAALERGDVEAAKARIGELMDLLVRATEAGR